MRDGFAEIANLDPDAAVSALLSALSQKEIAEHLNGVELGEELTRALRYSVRLGEMKSAMSELRQLLDSARIRSGTIKNGAKGILGCSVISSS